MDNNKNDRFSWKFVKGVFLIALIVMFGSFFLTGYFNSKYVADNSKKEFKFDYGNVEYTYEVNYNDYDWSWKLNQLSQLKNIFTPFLSDNSTSLLQNAIMDIQNWAKIGYVVNSTSQIVIASYWPSLMSREDYQKIKKLMNRDSYKWVSTHYYIEDVSRNIIRRSDNINDVFGNDNSDFFTNLFNTLSLPLAIVTNLFYDVGVLINFVVNW